jgi:hypothetical protein
VSLSPLMKTVRFGRPSGSSALIPQQKSTRREAAHAIAKTLVTTNPHILSEHLRLGVMRPLIFLCR